MFDFESKIAPEARVEEVTLDAEALQQVETEIVQIEADFEALQVEEGLLLSFGTAVENKLQSIDKESLTAADVESFRAYVVGAASVLNMSPTTVGMDTESEIVDPKASFDQDLEGLKDFAKKAWEYIKKMVAKFSNMVRKVTVKIMAAVGNKTKSFEELTKTIQDGEGFESVTIAGGGLAKSIYATAIVEGEFDEKGTDLLKVLQNVGGKPINAEELVKAIKAGGEDGWLGKTISDNKDAKMDSDLEKGIDKKSKEALKGGEFYIVRPKCSSVVGIKVSTDGKVSKETVKLEKMPEEVMIKTLDDKAALDICKSGLAMSKGMKEITTSVMGLQDDVTKLIADKEKAEEEVTSELKTAFNIAPFIAFQTCLAHFDAIKKLEQGVTFSMAAKVETK